MEPAASDESVSRSAGAWVVAAFVLSLAAVPAFVPPIWPLAQLGLLLPALGLVLVWPACRPLAKGIRKGSVRPGLIVLVGASSAVALTAWARLTAPDLDQAMAMVPDVPGAVLIAGAVGFAVVNATLEEVAFRGVLQSALEAAFGPTRVAIALQAVAFGIAHLNGVPNGPLGAVMAGTWALVLGWVRTRSEGLLTPILGHIVADLVIFALLASGAASP